MLVIIADKEKPDLAFLALIPVALFLALDTYYLALEKGFRNAYKSFVTKVHDGALRADVLYSVTPEGKSLDLHIAGLKSFSVWGFYGSLSVLILVARSVVLS